MNSEELVDRGNLLRSEGNFHGALEKYALALAQSTSSFSAYNNFGNVLREVGQVQQAIPFLQAACAISPDHATANFNLAVAYLSLGDYDRGWPLYEHRWNYEHLAGQLPALSKPKWQGQDLKDKTILVIGEQGHGDIVQFSRFLVLLKELGACIKLCVNQNVFPLFQGSIILDGLYLNDQDPGEYDYWSMIMSLPLHLKTNLDNLPAPIQYITAHESNIATWRQKLGTKEKIRVGLAYSGRRDSWINQHKSMPVESVITLIQKCSDVEWINLQADASDQDLDLLTANNVRSFPNSVSNWADTAGLVQNLDLVISVDTAVAHLAGAMGRPTWVPLSRYATCWRWGTESNTMPWYPTMKLFRQDVHGDWSGPINKIAHFLKLFKV
jgi:tetratricopeptide (TPR) repeat protein